MNTGIHKSMAMAILMTFAGAAYASEPVAVNTEGMSPRLAAQVQQKAQEGVTELRLFVIRTRTIYGLDLRTIVRG